jgi:hypothetical protein
MIMPSHPNSDRLRAVKRLDQLIAYLRDELDWPIESNDVEDISFSYEPEELGLDAEHAAKIDQIKQIRPLHSGQPWGIFWVSFEKKRLPVVVLRRILGSLVVKSRQSANSADRPRWKLNDLLFVSAYGDEESDQREIAFAHFSQSEGDLPTLRVLGWDGDDTVLKLDHVAFTLAEKLRWPANPADADAWRRQWSSAFRHRLGHVIRTSDMLAERLAELSRNIRSAASRLLEAESEQGKLTKLFRAFQAALIHDLTPDSFADAYAQTITYGLFTAAINRTEMSAGTAGTFVKADDITILARSTSPFLKEMLETFLHVGGRKNGVDFDELGIQDVVELLRGDETDLPAILRDFGNRTRGEDPVIHFYEHFLSAYNKKLKIQRGVFYTPHPVVSYIVRSVHELLQSEFGLEEGLASTVTWREMLQRHKDLKLPTVNEPGEPEKTICPDEPFVQVLDPATGTATFLVEVIDVIHKHLKAKWDKGGAPAMPRIPSPEGAGEGGRRPGEGRGVQNTSFAAWWNEYVPASLLPRLHGYELLAAPYAIAHLKLGLKLTETGYRFGSDERARIYLTNALEPKVRQLPQIGFEPLAHEAKAVNEIKWYKRFTVVIGNPPYSNYGQLNKNPWILGLLDDYKRGLGEKKINLDDDFIKFLRFCQVSLDESRTGLLGLITNHTYLDGVTHRRLRESLLASFLSIRVADLHGSIKKAEQCPDGSPDKNVFDIQQGVAIGIFSTLSNEAAGVWHSDVWGVREAKYEWLQKHSAANTPWKEITPTPDRFYFVPHNLASDSDYNDFLSIRDAFVETATGFETARDHFAISFTEQDLKIRVQGLVGRDSDEAIRSRWSLDDKRDWQLTTSRARLRQLNNPLSDIRSCCYRPFDNRFTHYNDVIVTWPRMKVLGCIDDKNPALVAARMVKGEQPNHFFVVNQPTEKIFISGKTSNNAFIFPLYQREGGQVFLTGSGRKLNFREDFLAKFRSKLMPGENDFNIERFATDIFHYTYGVFHSPGYRSRYAEFLKIDFPRLPLTGNLELFRALARLGGELVALHLLESPTLDHPITEYVPARHSLGGGGGGRTPEVEKVSWSRNTVWVDKAQTMGFKGVREEVWNFHIGGYQVCEKWLKDRKGRQLSADDRTHYHKIVVALSETIRLMAEIDAVIEQSGGWPLK